MLSLEEALQKITARLPLSAAKTVSLDHALGHVLAEDQPAPCSLPLFDNSAMDGYAVCASGLNQASASQPVVLSLIGHIAAGSSEECAVPPGACARIFTGSPLPKGADAVVMQEDCEVDGAKVRFHERVAAWENVRLEGEDIRKGETALEAGTRIGPAQIAMAAAVGCSTLRIRTPPRVALLATGSELREPGEAIARGQIYESNRHAVQALLASGLGEPIPCPLVPDQLEQIEAQLQRALDHSDVVVTMGGVSVGEHDLVKEAFQRLGGKLEFWKISIKPGKPFVFGTWRDRFLFGLPGNPVSAWVTCLLLVLPALRKMQGCREINPPRRFGKLGEAFRNRGDRTLFARVTISNDGSIRSSGGQGSHQMKSLSQANGLLRLEPGVELSAGTFQPILCWD